MKVAQTLPYYTQKQHEASRCIGQPIDMSQGGGCIGSQQVTSWEDAIKKVICGSSWPNTSKISYIDAYEGVMRSVRTIPPPFVIATPLSKLK